MVAVRRARSPCPFPTAGTATRTSRTAHELPPMLPVQPSCHCRCHNTVTLRSSSSEGCRHCVSVRPVSPPAQASVQLQTQYKPKQRRVGPPLPLSW